MFFSLVGISAHADKLMVITVDDMPANKSGNNQESTAEILRPLINELGQRSIPAIGFVNEGQMHVDGAVDPAQIALLEAWLEAGLELGNHSFSHMDLHRTPLERYLADVKRGESVIGSLGEKHASPVRYFRHPYLHTGMSLETKAAVEADIAGRGYEVAPVTIDNSEWIYAHAYALTLANGDHETAFKLKNGYIAYMDAVIAYYEQQSEALLGYQLPQILLIHANRLNADTINELLDMIEKRGYRFIALEEALNDPAYELPDTFVGRGGITWLHRWALTAGRKGKFFAGEPVVTEEVRHLAGFK